MLPKQSLQDSRIWRESHAFWPFETRVKKIVKFLLFVLQKSMTTQNEQDAISSLNLPFSSVSMP